MKEDQDIYFGDIADHIRKIWDGLEDCKEVVDGLADTSNWLTSHRIQEVMRVLTIVMAIMTPPMLHCQYLWYECTFTRWAIECDRDQFLDFLDNTTDHVRYCRGYALVLPP